MSNAIDKLFFLAVLLVIAAYFVGVSTDAATFFAGAKSLGLTFTGRDANGNFAAYPKGAPAAPAAA